jgi:hypothetical protein
MANKGATRLTQERVTDTLEMVLAAWEPAYPYRLVGTGAALLQGVDLPAGDIDILCREREAVDEFAAAMAGFPALQEPAWLAGDRQYYCNYDVAGVEVGASTVEFDVSHDTAETLGDGPWRHFRQVPVGEHRVPAVRLELRLATEIVRRRRDRSEPLIAFLRTHGCDTDLVGRALSNAGVPERTWERVLATLTPER